MTSSHERTLRAKKNVIASFGLKGISIVVDLLLIPLTIAYVNPSQYGIWLTLSSIITWISFFDIGLGNGLRNKLAESNAKGNFSQSQKYVSTTYAILAIIFTVIWLLFQIVNSFLNWSFILNAPLNLAAELSILSNVVFSFFCLQIIFKIITTILVADQKSAKAALLNLFGQILSLLLIYLLSVYSTSSLLYLAAVLAGVPVFIYFLASIYYFKGKYQEITPSINSVDFSCKKDILPLGFKFFLIQVAYMIIFQANNLIIAQTGTPKDVTVYNVAYKYMGITLMTYTILITPFWSAFTEAYTKREILWIKKTVNKLRKISLVQIVLVVILLLCSDFLYKIWLPDINIPFKTTLAIGIFMIVYSIVSLNTIVLNGIGKIKIQMIGYSLASLSHVPVALYLGSNFGIPGVIFSATVFFGVIAVVFNYQVNLILGQKAKGIWDS